MRVAVLLSTWLAATPCFASPVISWDPIHYDPAAVFAEMDGIELAAPDLVIPLPCEGAIAMVRVETEAQANNPMDDQRIRVGHSSLSRAPTEYTRSAYIRGAFPTEGSNRTHYYIGRYEVTVDQYNAIKAWAEDKKCPEQSEEEGSLPITNLSWFEAQNFAALVSTWARSEVPELLPRAGNTMGFFRLPSEIEWEFAARGGLAARERFNEMLFPMDGPILDYAWYDDAESANGELRPVGRLFGNPLGLFDVYGNAEEMAMDLFSLNRGGRQHGQYGGYVTRGGSIDTRENELRSAWRTEYPFYAKDQATPYSSGEIGLRLVISSFVLNSGQVIQDLQSAWKAELEPNALDDPRGLLTKLIKEETEVARAAELESVQSALIAALQRADEATALALRRAIFSGAALQFAIESVQNRKERVEGMIRDIRANIEDFAQDKEAELSTAADNTERSEIEAYYADLESAETISLTQSEKQLVQYDRRLDINGTNFVSTVHAVFESSTPETMQREADLLIAEMERSDQLEMIIPINIFVAQVAAFRDNPSMTREELLKF